MTAFQIWYSMLKSDPKYLYVKRVITNSNGTLDIQKLDRGGKFKTLFRIKNK